MMKIIFIHFVFIVIYCETAFLRGGVCYVPKDKWNRDLFFGVCGTDGHSYRDVSSLKCQQQTEYGKQVNLQLSHNGACFEWRLLWNTILPFLIVSKYKTDSALKIILFLFKTHCSI